MHTRLITTEFFSANKLEIWAQAFMTPRSGGLINFVSNGEMYALKGNLMSEQFQIRLDVAKDMFKRSFYATPPQKRVSLLYNIKRTLNESDAETFQKWVRNWLKRH